MELKAIQHLIETDEKTCARIERHHAQRKQLKDEAEVIKQKMRDEVAQETSRIISETKAQLDSKIQEESRANEAYFASASADLGKQYRDHKDEWCNQLVKRITALSDQES